LSTKKNRKIVVIFLLTFAFLSIYAKTFVP
jgi:hypothetical protein